MKKEAVKMRPKASVMTESVGYNESGIGLVIAFGAIIQCEEFESRS